MKAKRRTFLKVCADLAFNQAAIEVVKLAKEAGTPVVIWQDGKLVELDPHTIQLKTSPKAGNAGHRD